MNFTAAELRDLAEMIDANDPKILVDLGDVSAALREYADLKEAAEKGVTDEVVRAALDVLWPRHDDRFKFRHNEGWMNDMRAAIESVAPLLALKGDKP
jgi:hypothetical protein